MHNIFSRDLLSHVCGCEGNPLVVTHHHDSPDMQPARLHQAERVAALSSNRLRPSVTQLHSTTAGRAAHRARCQTCMSITCTSPLARVSRLCASTQVMQAMADMHAQQSVVRFIPALKSRRFTCTAWPLSGYPSTTCARHQPFKKGHAGAGGAPCMRNMRNMLLVCCA